MTDNPNRVYERLVESEEDLIGLLAVGLYEQHRMDWFARLREQTGSEPTPDQSNVFLAGVLVDRQLEAYRGRASEVLARYADTVLETQLPQVAQNAVSGRLEHAVQRVERSGRFSRLLLAGFLGALLFVLLVVAGLAAARYAGVNFPALTNGVV